MNFQEFYLPDSSARSRHWRALLAESPWTNACQKWPFWNIEPYTTVNQVVCLNSPVPLTHLYSIVNSTQPLVGLLQLSDCTVLSAYCSRQTGHIPVSGANMQNCHPRTHLNRRCPSSRRRFSSAILILTSSTDMQWILLRAYKQFSA